MSKTIKGLGQYWRLYFELVNEVLKTLEGYSLDILPYAISKEWQEEKENALRNYFEMIDTLSDSLPLRPDIKRPRLICWEEVYSAWGAKSRDFLMAKRTVKLTSINDVLREYSLAKKHNTLDEMKHNLSESYGKYVKELDALEATLETPAQQKIKLPEKPTRKEIAEYFIKSTGKDYAYRTIEAYIKEAEKKDGEIKTIDGGKQPYRYPTEIVRDKIIPFLRKKAADGRK